MRDRHKQRESAAPSPSASRWYAANTISNRETTALVNLERQGFEAFLPLYQGTVRHARRLVSRRAPLFPGYVFVRLDPSRDRWRSINGTIGVRSIVMAGRRPLPVPAGIVEGLMALVDARGFVATGADLRSGDRIEVVNGPLASLVGTLVAAESRDRVRVFIELMNAGIPVSLDRKDVIRAA